VRIQVTKLTRNITKDHLSEIFGTYGTVAHVEVPGGNGFSFSFRHQAFIEYESSEDAAKAAKFMDGGQIDGQEIMVTLMKGAPQRRRSPPRRRSNSRDRRERRRSPRRESPPRRHRRGSTGSSSSD
jgi:RNA-binding protein with serine-rich domain 1